MNPSSRLLPLVAAILAAPGVAQVVNPADKVKPPAQDPLIPPDVLDPNQVSTTTVTAKRVSEYREEDLIGPYDQPAWTATRRFPTTRVYVRPPGTFEFEYWKRLDVPKHGPAETVTQYEFELGLPGRFQLDMYLVANQEGNGGEAGFNEEKFEIRWALADWNKIWGNPTLYLELASRDQEPDAVEAKLLFGGEISPGWHWGSNLVFEHETSGDMTNEHEITAGVSRVLQDERLSLGGEIKAALINTAEDRNEFEEELLVGPSLQFRPLRNVHLDLATLVGIGPDSPDFEGFFVLGYEF
ncbi:MAG TPA: hypothetical protein VGR31_05120 [Planctomycetota bacterium]|nr:hypothetical protein [Planctomycetota bacterium]